MRRIAGRSCAPAAGAGAGRGDLPAGVRLRDLVSDLNLVSRLEYDMQPWNANGCARRAVRRAVTDFMNAMPEIPAG
ncbi:MAG: hypothetical protein ACLS8R_09585 [Anaeromassilibacillus sp.]